MSRVLPLERLPQHTDIYIEMEAPLVAGDTLGPYQIVRLLGKGGMGHVYQAVEVNLKRQVALKVLSPPTSPDNASADLLTEARTLASVSHLNVVSIFTADIVAGVPIIAMEYVEGLTLRQLCDRFILQPGQVIPIALQMLDGVQALHARQILHRDMTPGNIALNRSGIVKLLDFGIAKDLTLQFQRTATGLISGTPHYMAPELFTGHPATTRSDLWSVGAVLLECLTGRKLAKDPTLADQILREAGVPLELAQFIAKLSAFRYEERYGSAELAHADLKSLTTKAKIYIEPLPKKMFLSITNLPQVRKYLAGINLDEVQIKRVLAQAVAEDSATLATAASDQTVKFQGSTDLTLTRDSLDRVVERMHAKKAAPPRPVEPVRARVRVDFSGPLNVFRDALLTLLKFVFNMFLRSAILSAMVLGGLWYVRTHGIPPQLIPIIQNMAKSLIPEVERVTRGIATQPSTVTGEDAPAESN